MLNLNITYYFAGWYTGFNLHGKINKKMENLKDFDPNGPGNPNYNLFGLPSTEDNSLITILPVPWEVTVSFSAGTARAAEQILKGSMQVDLYDPQYPDTWRNGYFMLPADKKILLKSDYLRKEAELYIDYISKGEKVKDNSFMEKTLKEINEGGEFLTTWVYNESKRLLEKNKLVGILGGDHSVPFGYYKAIAEKYEDFGILHLDAHCDLRENYEAFTYSHASIMYNTIENIPQVSKLVQVGIRDYCLEEVEYIEKHKEKISVYFDRDIKHDIYNGGNWGKIADKIVADLPQHVFISFDIDALDPKYCPATGTPVMGGFEPEQIFFLIEKVLQSGRKLIGFDLVETGVGETEWDSNVSARVLFKLCNYLAGSNLPKE